MLNFKKTKTPQLDPLYVIFEQHLYHFNDSELDRKEFIRSVLEDYLKFLRKNQVTVPKQWEEQVFEELARQVQTMLVKKIYGCLTMDEFQKTVPSKKKRSAKAQYSRLKLR